MTCKIDACERPVQARGWCRLHYSRWYFLGDPLAELPDRHKVLTCESCGETFESARGRARFCSQRCGKRSRQTMPCAQCGGPVWRGRGSLPQGEATCRACRGAKSCIVCQNPFTGGGKRVTCSAACAAVRQRDANRRPRATRPCTGCGTPVSKHGKALCGPCAKERLRAHYQAKNRRRRALKRQSDAEPYTTTEIAARDRYRCGLCGKKVSMQLAAPHPRSPSIDHVIPIAEGGGDVRANVQLAHWICNVRKGARGAQQLALIG